MIRLHQTFGAHAGRVLELDLDVVRFGRLPDNEVCFDPHADLDASGRHAEVRREGAQWILVDVGSRNGTLIAGQRITRHVLTSGDEIEFGVGGPRVRIELLTTAGSNLTAQATPISPGGMHTGPSTPMPMGSPGALSPPSSLPASAQVPPSSEVSLPIGEPAHPTPPPSPFNAADPTPITPPPPHNLSPVGVPVVSPAAHHPSGPGSQPGYTPAPAAPKRYGQRTVGMMIQAALSQADQQRAQGGNRSTAFLRAVATEAAQSSSRGLKIAIGVLAFLLLLTLAAVVALFFYARWQEEQLRDENVSLQQQIAELGEGETTERARLSDRIQELNDQLSDQQERSGSQIAEENDSAVWALLRTRGNQRTVLCSAFAVRRDLLATNAHCVEALERARGRGDQIEAVANHASTGVAVGQMWRHPRYEADAPASPDVGLIRISGTTTQQVRLASMSGLRELSAGDDVFVLGFPTAIASGGAPVAGIGTGVVGRVTAFDGTPAQPDARFLVSHSAFSDDGTAGSPVFNLDGEVIAVNAGNFRARRRVTDTGTRVTRTVESETPYAWAVRADLLMQILAGLPE